MSTESDHSASSSTAGSSASSFASGRSGPPVPDLDQLERQVTALGSSLPCSGGEQRMLRITASLADGIPVDLRDTLIGLDQRNAAFVVKAMPTQLDSHCHYPLAQRSSVSGAAHAAPTHAGNR